MTTSSLDAATMTSTSAVTETPTPTLTKAAESTSRPVGPWRWPELLRRRSSSTIIPESETPEAAYQRGIDDGATQAASEFMAEMQNVLETLRGTGQALLAEYHAWQHTLRTDAGGLIEAIVSYVILQELTVDPTIVQRIVEAALEAAGDSPGADIFLHPDDLQALRQLDGHPDADDGLRWLEDPSLHRGDCRVVTPDRLVDGRIHEIIAPILEEVGDA